MSERDSLADLELDRTIHERARLMILTHLASSRAAETGFTDLKDELGISAGNLSLQIKNLEEAGYLIVSKSYRDNKPYTGIRLSFEGKRALETYLGELEVIVSRLKGGRA